VSESGLERGTEGEKTASYKKEGKIRGDGAARFLKKKCPETPEGNKGESKRYTWNKVSERKNLKEGGETPALESKKKTKKDKS